MTASGVGGRRRTSGHVRRRRLVVAVVLGALVAALVLVGRSDGRPTHRGAVDPVVAQPGAQQLDPGFFVAGSCVSLPRPPATATRPSSSTPVTAGSTPESVGTTESGSTIYEADETLPVELDTMALLRAQGFRVVVSRTGASTVVRPGPGDVSDGVFTVQGEHRDVAAEIVCANMAKATVLLGIYFDAGPSAEDAGSVTGYDADRPFWRASLRLANLVQNDVVAAMDAQGWGIPDDGVVSTTRPGRPRPVELRRVLRTPPAARPGVAGLLLHPEPDARCAHRAAVHHRPVRGVDRRQHRGQHVIAQGWLRPSSGTSHRSAPRGSARRGSARRGSAPRPRGPVTRPVPR